jgi:hypothetical protein
MSRYIIKNNKKIITIVSLFIIVLIYWNVQDIHSRIFSSELSDLQRYFYNYNNLSYIEISEKDFGYSLITGILQKIGVSFEVFLFTLFFLYYLIFCKIFYRLSHLKGWIIYILLILLTSFWMDYLIGAVLRQGIAFMIMIYFLFSREVTGYKLSLLIVLIASSVHLSALLFIVFVILEKYWYTRIKLLDLIFVLSFLFYVLGLTTWFANFVLNFAIYFDFNLRSLWPVDDHPTSGFSIYKAIAIYVPALAFRLTNFPKKFSKILSIRIYWFYSLTCIAGMFLSALPYHDRIMLYGWAISPILLTIAIYKFLISSIDSSNKNNKIILKNNKQFLKKSLKGNH